MDPSLLTKYSIIDISVILLYLIGVITLTRKFKRISVKVMRLFVLISLVHVAMTVGYYLYSLYDVADSIGYYRKVLFIYDSWGACFGQGTYFIYFTLYPIINFLHVSYFGSFFIYSFFGLVGYYFVLKVLLHIANYEWTNWYYILIMPLIHFWTVAIGKDSLIFFGIAMLVYNIYFQRKWVHYIIPILLVGFIRIHILFFVIAAFGIAQLFLNKNIRPAYKLLLVGTIVAGMVALFPILLERIDFKAGQSLTEQVELLSERELAGGSSVNVKDSNILVKWVSYIFRPLFVDAHNVFALAASVENLVWVMMFFVIFRKLRTKIVDQMRSVYWFSVFAIIAITLPGAFLLSNLGVAARQKTMVVPFVFILLFITLYKSRKDVNTMGIEQHE